MVRSLLLLLAFLLMFLVVVVFALSNPGEITLDLAFTTLPVKTSVAFAVAVAGGWLWGVISMLAYMGGLWRDRRALRKQLRLADTELKNLRALPVHDAG